MDLGVSAAVALQLGNAVAREPDVRAVLEVWPLRSQLRWGLFPNDFDPTS